MPRFAPEPRPISTQHQIAEFYREEFLKHRRCLQQQRPYYSESAITDVEAALTRIMSQLEQLSTEDNAPQLVSSLLKKFDVVTGLSAWSDPSQTHSETLTRSLTALRQDLLAIVRAGIRAVHAAELTRQALADAARNRDVFYRCIAAGKAASSMAKGAASVLKDRLRAGLLVASTADAFGSFEAIAGGHPVPDAGSERAGRRALAIAEGVASDETLLVLLSGGASALVAAPADGITLEDKQRTTSRLLRAGADIHALNTVRKHLSAIKGGWLAKRAAGPVRTYVISDVVGDDVSVIASGPTVPDPSTFADARQLLDRYGGTASYPAAVVERLDRGVKGKTPETPKPVYPRLVRSDVHVIGSRGGAMFGAAAKAVALGYHVVRLEAPVVGEAREAAGPHLQAVAETARANPRPLCIVSS